MKQHRPIFWIHDIYLIHTDTKHKFLWYVIPWILYWMRNVMFGLDFQGQTSRSQHWDLFVWISRHWFIVMLDTKHVFYYIYNKWRKDNILSFGPIDVMKKLSSHHSRFVIWPHHRSGHQFCWSCRRAGKDLLFPDSTAWCDTKITGHWVPPRPCPCNGLIVTGLWQRST